jgi:dTDP-4-dehydrorhamnose reductase
MKKKTIVIFGISSFVGSTIAEYLKEDYRIIGTYHKNRVTIPDVLTLPCDIMNKDTIQMILYRYQPEFTIYAIGLPSVEKAAEFERLSDALNTGGVFNVTQYTERYKSKFIYISSAYVFSGDDEEFRENDSPLPNTTYGHNKVQAEFYIQKSCLNYLIIRCCNLYGRSLQPFQRTLLEALEYKFHTNDNIRCDDKVTIGYLDIIYLVEVLKTCLEADVTNRLFHLSSKDAMSPYQFAKNYAKIFRFSEDLVQKGVWPFPISEFSGTEANPEGLYNYRINVDNLEIATGLIMPTIVESLERTFERWGGALESKKGNNKSAGISYI